MMTWCSWWLSKGHFPKHSALVNSEAPIQDSPVSSLDEGISSQGSQDRWDHMKGKKLLSTIRAAFQNIDGLVPPNMDDEDMKLNTTH